MNIGRWQWSTVHDGSFRSSQVNACPNQNDYWPDIPGSTCALPTPSDRHTENEPTVSQGQQEPAYDQSATLPTGYPDSQFGPAVDYEGLSQRPGLTFRTRTLVEQSRCRRTQHCVSQSSNFVLAGMHTHLKGPTHELENMRLVIRYVLMPRVTRAC